MKRGKVLTAIAVGIFLTMTLSSQAAIFPDVWGIDEDDGQLFSIHQFFGEPVFVDYGRLKYDKKGHIKKIGNDIESFVLALDGTAYMVINDNLGKIGEPVLLSFDTRTASTSEPNVATVLGTLGIVFDNGKDNITGLSYDPISGALFGLFRDNNDRTVDKLLNINTADLSVTTIGEIKNSTHFAGSAEDMVFDPQGNLYVADNDDDHLYQIDPSTGAIIALIDGDLADGIGKHVKIEALAWDWENNSLIGFDDKSDKFVFLTLEDGNNRLIAGIDGLTDIEGLRFAPVPIPGSVILLLSGLLGLFGIRKIRRKP